MRRMFLGLLLSLLLAAPARATMLSLRVVGSLGASTTDTGSPLFIANAPPPLTVIVGYTSVNGATVTVTVQASMDGLTWTSPGLVAATPTTTVISENITGNGSYLIFPILVAIDPGGAGTTDIPGHIGPWVRVTVLNNSGATAITDLRIAIMSN